MSSFLARWAALAAVALPAYQDYSVRSKVSEVILAASACRTLVTEVVQSTVADKLPDANQWGCEKNTAGNTTDAPTKYVLSIVTNDAGKITVTTTDVADLKEAKSTTVDLIPMKNAAGTALVNNDVGEQIYGWKCGHTTVTGTQMPIKYLPATCRGQF